MVGGARPFAQHMFSPQSVAAPRRAVYTSLLTRNLEGIGDASRFAPAAEFVGAFE
jgi:hypothetical protein